MEAKLKALARATAPLAGDGAAGPRDLRRSRRGAGRTRGGAPLRRRLHVLARNVRYRMVNSTSSRKTGASSSSSRCGGEGAGARHGGRVGHGVEARPCRPCGAALARRDPRFASREIRFDVVALQTSRLARMDPRRVRRVVSGAVDPGQPGESTSHEIAPNGRKGRLDDGPHRSGFRPPRMLLIPPLIVVLRPLTSTRP